MIVSNETIWIQLDPGNYLLVTSDPKAIDNMKISLIVIVLFFVVVVVIEEKG